MSDHPNGIARKTRADKGVPRRASIDDWVDRWMEWPADKQRSAIDVLEALHRQAIRGSIRPTKETTNAADGETENG